MAVVVVVVVVVVIVVVNVVRWANALLVRSCTSSFVHWFIQQSDAWLND